jgi:hypothetical protein
MIVEHDLSIWEPRYRRYDEAEYQRDLAETIVWIEEDNLSDEKAKESLDLIRRYTFELDDTSWAEYEAACATVARIEAKMDRLSGIALLRASKEEERARRV